jgi:hypothetical protein
MPPPTEILHLLDRTANDAVGIALSWHVALLTALVAVAAGWRPTYRQCGRLLVAPLLSVAVVAAAYGNPFNAIAFGVLAGGLFALAGRLSRVPVAPAERWSAWFGASIAAFGWVYPHFLGDESAWLYVIAAPTGVLPCPTLALVVGASMLVGGLGSRTWSTIVAVAALYYGVTGAVRLGVTLDWVLVIGALGLLGVALRLPGRHASVSGPPPVRRDMGRA